MSKERAAMRAMLEWIDSEGDSVLQALRHMAHANAKQADETGAMNLGAVAKVLRESAESWSKKADRLNDLLDTLPDRELF